jgi:hypothetical protein
MTIAQLTQSVILIDLPLLIVLTSLVYSASRHETWKEIGLEAIRWGTRLALFMLSIVAGLLVVGWL